MAVSRALRRLLHIRNIEEEQSKLALDAAVSDQHRLENVLLATIEREHQGRRLLAESIHSGQWMDRMGSLEEMRVAKLREAVLQPMIAEAKIEVAECRQEFLQRRVDRRQAETLIEEAEAMDAVETARRSQMALDDWFRNQLYRRGNQAAKEVESQSGENLRENSSNLSGESGDFRNRDRFSQS